MFSNTQTLYDSVLFVMSESAGTPVQKEVANADHVACAGSTARSATPCGEDLSVILLSRRELKLRNDEEHAECTG